jgi:hypothetical protein
MAKLDDVAKDLNVTLPVTSNEKVIGHKRRSWLEQDDTSTTLSTENRIYPGFDQLPTDNKLVANREQTESKLRANREQSGSKVGAISVAKWEQSGSATGSTIGSKVVANWEQTGSKLGAKITFSELVGLQRDIIIFICHECKKSRSRITEALTLEYMAKSIKRSAGAVKNAIGRLEKKSCLIRVEFKNGRGGWSRYEVPDSIYHDALRIETGSKPVANWEQTGSKLVAQPVAQPVANASCSSSFKDLKITTTELSDEWNFDIATYAQFGFTKTQIKQLATSGVISSTDVEQSLIEFSYDLDNNALPSIKTTKINFLMGLLWKGQAYVSEGFKNEQDAMIAEMASRASKKRESLLKAKFEAWESGLGGDERKEIEKRLPTHLTVLHRTYGISHVEVRNWFFDYYLQVKPQ